MSSMNILNNSSSDSTTTFPSSLLLNQGAILRPIPINPTALFPLKFEIPLPMTNFEEPVGTVSTTSSSRCSSADSSTAPGKIRRGRPQQEIADGQDAHSQKKRHRRLYARQYRAQMRQKVENVKSLHDEKEQLETEVKMLRQTVSALQQELAQKDLFLSFMHLNSQLNHS